MNRALLDDARMCFKVKIAWISFQFRSKHTTLSYGVRVKNIFCSCSTVKKNCAELYKSDEKISDPDGAGAFDVFCDQTTAGGGWTVFQKRLDGSVNFYRGRTDYKNGFGNLNGEFWLGLDKIHRLTKSKNKLRVDLEDTTGKTAYTPSTTCLQLRARGLSTN